MISSAARRIFYALGTNPRASYFTNSKEGNAVPHERVSDVEEATKALVEIQIQLARIEKTLEQVPTLAATIETTKELAREAMQSVKSAHQRLDRIEDGQKWLWRTLSGAAITIVMGAIAAAVQLAGH